jgi:hypothetical protein
MILIFKGSPRNIDFFPVKIYVWPLFFHNLFYYKISEGGKKRYELHLLSKEQGSK